MAINSTVGEAALERLGVIVAPRTLVRLLDDGPTSNTGTVE